MYYLSVCALCTNSAACVSKSPDNQKSLNKTLIKILQCLLTAFYKDIRNYSTKMLRLVISKTRMFSDTCPEKRKYLFYSVLKMFTQPSKILKLNVRRCYLFIGAIFSCMSLYRCIHSRYIYYVYIIFLYITHYTLSYKYI